MTRLAALFLPSLLLTSAALRGGDTGPANVVQFGAGTGVDDTDAIQNALNYVCSLPQGREVYFPPGTYVTSRTVEIPCGYITLSSGASAWNYGGDGPAMVIRQAAVLVRLVNLKIRGNATSGSFGLQILGGPVQGVTGLFGVTKLIVEDCEFNGFGNADGGAAIDIEADSPGVTIRDSVFNNLGTAININAPTDTLAVRDNYFVSASNWGVKITNGIGAGTVYIEHNNFTTSGGAVRLDQAGLTTIRGNEYETYNLVKNVHSAPFDLISAQRVVFEDNTVNVHSAADYCVWVGDTITDSVFEKNILWNFARAGFRVGNGQRNFYMLNPGSDPPANPTAANATATHLLGYSSVVRFDGRHGNIQKITLSGDVKLSELVNASPGQRMVFMICQDNNGGRQFHWPSGFSGAMSISSEPSKCSVQEFLIDTSQKAYALGPGSKDQ
jgi:hypothetical protein